MFYIGRCFILTARVCVVAGLVILDARYGPAENDDDLEGLTINVTVPLQALVSKSQLYIPGRRTKVSSRVQCKHAVQFCFGTPYHRQGKSCQDLLLQCCRTLGDAARRCICACLSIFSQGQPCHNMDLYPSCFSKFELLLFRWGREKLKWSLSWEIELKRRVCGKQFI